MRGFDEISTQFTPKRLSNQTFTILLKVSTVYSFRTLLQQLSLRFFTTHAAFSITTLLPLGIRHTGVVPAKGWV